MYPNPTQNGNATALEKQVTFRCCNCAREYPSGLYFRCSECGSLVDPMYGEDITLRECLDNPAARFFDLLPIQRLDFLAPAWPGNTPCIHSAKLGALHGFGALFLKDESAHPTETTKDRMAACVIAMLAELGVKCFVASSTGNSSTALAYAVRTIPTMKLHLFCGRDFVSRHAYCDPPQVVLHVVTGDFVSASKEARKFARDNGLLFESGFFNPARREGLKLAYLEAFDQMPQEPHVVVQAVSSGMGVYGAYRGMREYQRMGRMHRTPRIVCVQQDTCAPMVRAFSDRSPTILDRHIVRHPSGIAEAILSGDPTQTYPYMFRLVEETQGTFCDVSREQIMEAWHALRDYHGIDADFAAAAALAGAFKLRQRDWVRPSDVVLVNITGGRRRSSSSAPELELTGITQSGLKE